MTIHDGFLAFDKQDQPVLILTVENGIEYEFSYWNVKSVGSLNGIPIYQRGSPRNAASIEAATPCYWIRGM